MDWNQTHCLGKLSGRRSGSDKIQATQDCIPRGPTLISYFNDGGGGGLTEVHILYPKKSQLQNFSTQKIPTFFSIPKKIPQCFCISKFYYLSSGKLKHANFNFGFGKKQNYTKTNTKSLHDRYSVSSSYLLRQLYRKIFIMTSTACLVLSTFFACYCTETSLCNRPRGIRLFTMFLCN